MRWVRRMGLELLWGLFGRERWLGGLVHCLLSWGFRGEREGLMRWMHSLRVGIKSYEEIIGHLRGLFYRTFTEKTAQSILTSQGNRRTMPTGW